MTNTKYETMLLYRGERFRIAAELDGWQWKAACTHRNGETLDPDLYCTDESYASPGEAIGDVVTMMIEAAEYVHAEMAMESERDGMAV
jgi:hypothetical protein